MKLSLKVIKYIIFIFLLQIIYSSDIFNESKYLKTFELQNEKILICTEKGILLYDYNNEQKIEKELVKFNVSVLKEDFDFVTISQFEEGEKYVIVTYKSTIYILTHYGEYFAQGNITFTPEGKYYALVPYKIFINDTLSEYHFILGYLGREGESKFLISYHSFNNNSKIFSLNVNSYILLPNINNKDVSTFNGFSCQIMETNIYKEVLTCFLHVDGDITVSSFNLNNLTLINNLTFFSKEKINPYNIRSFISSDKTKALICYLHNWQFISCEKYDIKTNSLTLIPLENNQDYLKCKIENSFTTIIYSSKKVIEYIFGCLHYGQDISLVKFNSNFEIESIIYNNKYTINNCESFSIVKLANNKTYSIFFTTQNQNPGILIKNDIPEGIKPSVDEIKKSTSIVKTTSYFVDEITYKTVYSNQISGNSIEFMPDESTSPNIFQK